MVKIQMRKLKHIIPIVTLLLIVFISTNVGSYPVSFNDLIKIFIDRIKGVARSDDPYIVIWRIRLPRIIMALLAGFGLGLCGSVMQSVLNNPMASPFTLGISSGAGFGAALAILFNISFLSGTYFIVFNAFFFSMASSLLIFIFSSRYKVIPETLVLTGIGLSYLFSASTILLEYFSSPEAIYNLQFWINGSLSKATWDKIIIVAFIQLISIPIVYLKGLDLDIMSYSDEQAFSLGIDVEQTRILLAGLVSLITSSIVCFTGVIGFIGLIAPHISRMLFGNENRCVMINSGIIGATLLILSDIVSSSVIPPLILPIGAVTALLGAPFFIYLIQSRSRLHVS